MSEGVPEVCTFELFAHDRKEDYGYDHIASEEDPTVDENGTWRCKRKSLPGSDHEFCVFHTTPEERRKAFDLNTARVAQIFLDLVNKPPPDSIGEQLDGEKSHRHLNHSDASIVIEELPKKERRDHRIRYVTRRYVTLAGNLVCCSPSPGTDTQSDSKPVTHPDARGLAEIEFRQLTRRRCRFYR